MGGLFDPTKLTVAICARNAAATIERAVASAVVEGVRVLLMDDGSEDGTVERVLACFGDRVEIAATPEHRTLGFARACAVGRIETEWLMWLDADDALLPGRCTRLWIAAVKHAYDGVWDAAELVDGLRGGEAKHLPVPSFMLRKGAAVRLFERNWLPGSAWPLLNTSFARSIGYDPDLPAAEDLDFNLRACARGGRLGFRAEVGYRQFAYPNSLSRDLVHQRHWVGEVLRRHAYEAVREYWHAAGFEVPVTLWGLISMALFRGDYESALAFLDELEVLAPLSDTEVLEPDGPWQLPEQWRRLFQRGTLVLLRNGDGDAIALLRQAEGLFPTAEGANNLGVAWRDSGDEVRAQVCFEQAQTRFPGYLDARLNARSHEERQVTVMPLRRLDYRSDY